MSLSDTQFEIICELKLVHSRLDELPVKHELVPGLHRRVLGLRNELRLTGMTNDRIDHYSL